MRVLGQDLRLLLRRVRMDLDGQIASLRCNSDDWDPAEVAIAMRVSAALLLAEGFAMEMPTVSETARKVRMVAGR